jgi:tetrahydromethanopterin S-methyltransferase subunit G
MTPEQRLDSIERSLDALAGNQVAERDSRLQLHDDLEILYQIVQQTDHSVNSLSERLDQLTGQIDRLTSNQSQMTQLFIQSVQRNEQDRAEIRRIWEYLLSQRTNGHGGS